MQKPANRILGALLVLVMIITMLPATVFATSETDVFVGWSLTLGEDIGVNFYLSQTAADYTVDITVAENEAAYTTATKDGYYVVSVNVAAAQMTDLITLTVTNGEQVMHTGEYSVRQYAEIILTGEYDDEVKQMAKQMLNLGAAAQTYFAYNTGMLANKGYEIDTPAAVPTEVPAIALEDNLDGVSLYGMSLLFQSKTAVRFYFVVDGNVADYTFKVKETEYTPVKKDDLYYVEVGNINPQDLGSEITVTVNDALTVSYNPLTYIVRKYNSNTSPTALKNLVQALYGYHLEALEYQEYQRIIQVGALQQHSNNTPWVKSDSETFIYFNTDAYTATTGEYTSLTADAIKLVRGGEVYSVANPGQGLLVKDNDTQHLLKITPWGMTGGHLPIQAHDYFIIEGRFESTSGDGTTIQIAKSYVYFDGTNVEISTTEPILPTTIDAGTMSAHSTTGWKSSAEAAGNLLFAMADNDAPSGYYRPTDASNVQLIRGGNTYVVGHNLRDTISKENNAQYVFEFWTIADHKPMVANDILVVEGDFYQESTKTMLNISKTYVLLNADGTATFSTEMPTLATVIDAGTMSAHSTTGWKSSAEAAGNLLFAMADNDAPSGYYRPTDASNVQLIRGGNTYVVGHNLRDTISKENNAQYVFEFWTIADHKPMVANDILVVEGDFYQESTKTMLNISKTYILLNADGTASFSTEMPTLQTIVDAGAMSGHEDGSASEIYFSLSENAVPVDENAETAYAGSVQLVRSGAVSTVSANIYKLDEGYYYLELDGVELADGDYLVVEGAFSNANNGYTMNITKTYVLVDGEALVYSETEPVPETAYSVESLSDHSNGMTISGSETLIYGTAAANDAPGGDWSYEYTPAEANGLKLIRDGVTYEVGINGQGTIVKYNSTDYCIKLAPWTVSGSKLPLVPGDIVVVEGNYTLKSDSSVVVNFAPTYILMTSETTVKLMSAMPNVISGGTMGGHNNARTANGFYATMAANNAPYSDWSLRYKPLAADVVKFVSGETTTNVANTGGEMLVKYSDTEYFFEGWTLSGTFADAVGNTYIINGLFYNAANDVYIDIDTTYVDITETDEMFYHIDAGMIGSHENGAGSDGVYATLAANTAPYDGWNIEYAPLTNDAYRVIRDGVETSIGMPGRGTLVKFSETGYYLKTSGWCVNGFTATTSDVFIIDGYWAEKNSSDPVLKMEKTYLYHDGTAWVFSTEAPAQKNIVDVVELGSHSNGWSTGGFYFTAAANDAPYDTTWALRYKPVSADVIKCISGDTTTNVGNTGGETIVKYSETEYYVEGWAVGSANLAAGNTFVIEGQFYNAANDVYIDVEKTYIILNADGTTTVLTDADKYINAGAMSAYSEKNWFNNNYTALYFVLESNNAPADEGWSVRYKPASANNVKLVRDGTTYTIGNTGAETIVKIADGTYALALDSWWWSAYAPIRDGDQLIIEGEFSNASNGYILNITKTYITFVSNAEDNVIFNAAADTEFGDVLLPSTNDTLTIGVWNGSYHVFEHKQLQELKDAGITKIMGIDTQWIGTTDVNAWLDRVYSYGISVIMDLRSWDGETVPSYASHPGVLGFLMYDEPCATEFDNLADLKEKFDAIDAFDGKLFYVNLFPSCAAKSSLYGGWTIGKNYETHYVQQFLDKLGVKVLSWDNYSLLDGNGIRTDYFYNFEVMASKTAEKWYTMLSCGHNTTVTSYVTPTAEQLRWQMAVAMTYGVQNIDHYTYVSHEEEKGYSCMVEYDTWKPTALYYDILQVDNEYLAWDNIFMAYKWKGVAGVKAGSSSTMLDMLENNINLSANGLASVSTTQDVLVGVFDYNGDKAYMVTNAGSAGSSTVGDGKSFTMTDATVTLNLADGNYKCAAIIDQGEITYVAVNNNQIVLDVEAYEGVFVIPVLN